MKNQIKKVLSIVLVAAMCLSSFALCVFAEECVHVWTELGRNDATCTENGTVALKCDLCGETKLEAIPASHTVESWDRVPATCTDAEYFKGKCTVEGCGADVISFVNPDDESDVLDPAKHPDRGHDTYEETVYAVHGTDVKYKVMIKCNDCTYAVDKEGTEIEDSNKHTLEWVITTNPTCTTTGVAKLVCTGEHTDPSNPCTYVEKDNVTIAALGHDTEDLGAETPACGEAGRKAHKNCKRCGADFKPELVNGELVPFEGSVVVPFVSTTYAHHISTNLVAVEDTPDAPHCTFVEGVPGGEDGYLEHVKCEKCDELFKYNGNDWVHVDAVVEDTYDATNAAHHTLEPVPEKAPKCGADGYVAHQKCTVCGALFTTEGGATTEVALKVEYVDTNFDHHNATFKPEVLPQCQPVGEALKGTKAHYACECGALFTAVTTGEGESAVTTYTKVVADDLKIAYEDANKNHHHYVENFKVDAQCTADGVIKYRCDRCYDEYEEVLTAPDHDYTNAVVDRTHDATCTEDGYTLRKCNNCDFVEKTDVAAKDKDHTNTTLVEIEAAKGATCTEAAKTAVMGCPNCDYTEGGEEIPNSKLDHEYTVKVIKDAATCTSPETYTMKCANCVAVEKDGENDKVYTGTTVPHTMTQVITAETTDCKVAGQIAQYCTECGGAREDGYYLLTSKQTEDKSKYVFYDEDEYSKAQVEALVLDHAWTIIEKVEANCITKGYALKLCTICGEITEDHDDYDTSVAGHEAAMEAAGKTPIVSTLIEATCLMAGTKQYECTACSTEDNHVYYKTENYNHEHRNDEKIPANCLTETNGREAGVYCVTLGKYIEGGETILFEHEDMITVPAQGATCTQFGWNKYEYCPACEAAETKGVKSKDACLNGEVEINGENVKVKIPAKGHEFAEDEDGEYIWYIDTPATCKEKGSKHRTCTLACGEEGHTVTEEIAKTACKESDLETLSLAPVCTPNADGTITSAKGFAEFTYCKTCFANDKNITAAYEAELVAALKVAYELPAHTVTTTNFGDETDCTVDSFTEHKCAVCGIYVITNFVEGADLHDWADPVAADCTNDGYTQCKNCDVKKNIIPAEKHVNAAGQTLENICTNASITDTTCVGCGYSILPHSEGYYTPVIIAPTCTSDGFTTKTCEYCGKSEVSDPKPALGHKGDEFVDVVTPPTISEKGVYKYRCVNDDHTYTKEVDELAEIGVSINSASSIKDGAAFVNGGLVTFTIDLTMPAISIDMIKAEFTYNPKQMTFVSATVNDSFAGDYLWVAHNDYVDYKTEIDGEPKNPTAGVVVTVNSTVGIGDLTRKDMVFEEGTVVEGFVTLTFRLAEDATATDAYLQAEAIQTKGTQSPRSDIASSAVVKDEIKLIKLGELSGSGKVIDLDDLAVIQDLIMAGETAYDARADLDMDGKITVNDWTLMRAIILKAISYEDLFANA